MGLDLLMDRLESRAPDTLAPRQTVDDLLERARLAAGRVVDFRKEQVRGLAAQLNALGPRQIMERGYSIVRLKGGPVLTRAAAASAGDTLEIDLHEGALEAEVKSGDMDGA
jgi:exonuclease VII large subunit